MDWERYRYPSYFFVALLGALVGGLMVAFVLSGGGRGSPAASLPAQGPAPSHSPAGRDATREPAVAVAQQVAPAVVGVSSQEVLREYWSGRSFLEPIGSGSGVIFDKGGYIVTNYHVVEGADQVVVALADGRRLEGQLVGADPPTDLAVLKVDAGQLTAVNFADSRKVRVGETAIAIGNPLGMEFQRSVTVGVVSGLRSFLYGQDRLNRVTELIQTDAAINPGNSGGALVNARAELIGINTFKLGDQGGGARGVEGMGFAIPSDTVNRVTRELVRYGRVRRASLGVEFLNREGVAALGLEPLQEGLLVYNISRRGPASRAGLRPGDVILAMDGQRVDTDVEVARLLEGKRPGDRLRLRFRRGDAVRTIDVTLDEMI